MKKDELNQERLGKIVALAKDGVGGEKATAIKMVKNLCKKHGLDFEAVMNDENVSEYEIEVSNAVDRDILRYVIYKYALLNMNDGPTGWRTIQFKTTKERYIEVLNAYPIYRRLFKQEKKKVIASLAQAFRIKHQLFYEPTPEEYKKIEKMRKEDGEPTPEELEEQRMALAMAGQMKDANIHKSLPKPI